MALAVGLCGEWAYANSGASGWSMARDLVVGWAFAVAGLVARWRRPGNPVGSLMLAEGLTWFLGNLQGTREPLLFALGAWGESLNVAVLGHLILAYPTGRLLPGATRWVVVLGYGLVAVGGLARATAFDPAASASATYLDCADCGPNALLLLRDPVAFEVIDTTYRVVGGLVVLVCLGMLVHRWRTSSPVRRRVLLPAWLSTLTGAVLLGAAAVYSLAPSRYTTVEWVLILLSDVGQVAVPVAFLAGLLRMRLRRAAVGNLVIEVGTDPTPGRLQGVLTEVTGDPTLRLGLWSEEDAGYRDTEGRPLRLPPTDSERGATVVDIAGRPTAVLVHDRSLEDDPELLAAVRASVRLGLENTSLRSEVNLRLEQVEAVSSRIVEAADRERRQLERDLHDGAQARLVYALMTLRQLDTRLACGTPTDRAGLRLSVAEAERALRTALDELRGLARGIHPAILTREGLGPAINALADQAAVPVVVMVEPGRYPAVVEATAYFAVCEALANTAKHAGAEAVSVSARHSAGRLVVEAVDDGVGGADPAGGTGLRGIADRLAAVGGELRVVSPPGRGTRIRVELPCE
ncbi:sensor histidine kinase [Wenjunlia vitaminophila]|uniref:sensor histidine kinase n=1 Tax=Wenjunlia vitaminophila TaxID=76728 RepID=UPI0003727C9F|nr:histidine kinase [Wenjunlia vitaminophila]